MRKTMIALISFLLAAVFLAACRLNNQPSARTVLAATYTSLAQTVESVLTMTAVADINNPLPSPEITLVTPGDATLTPTTVGGTPLPCDYVSMVSNITVPDNTVFSANQTFTKTWRLKNSGSCTWTTAYTVIFDSGNAMGGPVAFNLPGSVGPNQTFDLSIDLRAPATTGTYRANWKMRNANGATFGIDPGGNAPFEVQIIVVQPTITRTATNIYTRTITPTPTITKTRTITPTRTITRTPKPTRTRTPTKTPKATRTSKNTFTPAPALIYDFLSSSDSTTWVNGAGTTLGPDTSTAEGFYYLLTNPELQSGPAVNGVAIETFPQNVTDGSIIGSFDTSSITIAAGDYFTAQIGCLKAATNCNVRFSLKYSADGSVWTSEDTFIMTYASSVKNWTIPLSNLAGENVNFKLEVDANGSPIGDAAVWVAPRIMH